MEQIGINTPKDSVQQIVEALVNAKNNIVAALAGLVTTYAPIVHDHDANYAPIAKGITNGDAHDHSGGDGGQINHTTLSNIGANTHSQIDDFITAYDGKSAFLVTFALTGNDAARIITATITKQSGAALTIKETLVTWWLSNSQRGGLTFSVSSGVVTPTISTGLPMGALALTTLNRSLSNNAAILAITISTTGGINSGNKYLMFSIDGFIFSTIFTIFTDLV
ncbi:MAG: hypothetical protein WC389_05380 [Lutibacter sp.]|jgi:hypothetical protein